MNHTLLHGIDQIETFLAAASAVEFRFESTPACYAWIQSTLVRLQMMTPYDKLKSLSKAHLHLKLGVTFKKLDAIATAISDNDAAALL